MRQEKVGKFRVGGGHTGMRQKSATQAAGVGRVKRGSFEEAMVQKPGEEKSVGKKLC